MTGEHYPQEYIRGLIESLGCCPPGRFCTFKEIFARTPGDTRMLQQIKAIEIFKYHRSQREGRAIEWEEALDLWKAEGHAAAFGGVPVAAPGNGPNGATRELIEELACCPRGYYCTFKEILVRFAPRDSRTLMQLKCLELFKYQRSEQDRRPWDWNEALDRWVQEGYAATFARLFRDGCKFADLYAAVMRETPRSP